MDKGEEGERDGEEEVKRGGKAKRKKGKCRRETIWNWKRKRNRLTDKVESEKGEMR